MRKCSLDLNQIANVRLWLISELAMEYGIEMKFAWNWGELSGQRFLYARPKEKVHDADWLGFFEAELADFQSDTFLLLVNVVEVEEDIGFDLFSGLTELLKKLNVRRARIAVLPSNEHYPILMDLFNTLAHQRRFDLKMEIFPNRDAAEAWLGGQ